MSKPYLVGYCSHGVVGGCQRDDGPPCSECNGEGMLHYRVSREMAIDAGDESWEGSPVDIKCSRCEGTGVWP